MQQRALATAGTDLPALRSSNVPVRVRPLRTVRRSALVRYFNGRGVGNFVDTYA